jgi:hypothetical protein
MLGKVRHIRHIKAEGSQPRRTRKHEERGNGLDAVRDIAEAVADQVSTGKSVVDIHALEFSAIAGVDACEPAGEDAGTP